MSLTAPYTPGAFAGDVYAAVAQHIREEQDHARLQFIEARVDSMVRVSGMWTVSAELAGRRARATHRDLRAAVDELMEAARG